MNAETLIDEVRELLPSVQVLGRNDTSVLSAEPVPLVVALAGPPVASSSPAHPLADDLGELAGPLQQALDFACHHAADVYNKGSVTGPLPLVSSKWPPRPLLVVGLGPHTAAIGGPATGSSGADLLEPHGCSAPQEAGAALAAALKQQQYTEVCILLDASPSGSSSSHSSTTPSGWLPTEGPAAAALQLLSGLLVGLYSSHRHRGTPLAATHAAAQTAAGGAGGQGARTSRLRRVTLVLGSCELGAAEGQALAAVALARATGVWFTRSLVDAPANLVTPAALGAAAASITRLAPPGTMCVKLLDRAACTAAQLGLFMGVAAGSDLPPCLIHVTYDSTAAGGDTDQQPAVSLIATRVLANMGAALAERNQQVALVGKGLTFDSGGYNLKVAGGIEEMKIDMAGAAAVLGAAVMVALAAPAGLKAHFISAACENMVSSHATHPSDIHTSAAGLTVEVNDTDAEGRLTLADALWYAQHVAGARTLVDIATLTGACGIALGPDTGGVWSNSTPLAGELVAAGVGAGEKLWRMPLTRSLRGRLDSSVADMKNYAGRPGGAITAALFLAEFISPGIHWAHIDMAGPAWDPAAGLSTGYGAAMLGNWLLSQQRL